MSKLFLMAPLWVMMLLPLRASWAPDARRGLKLVLACTLVFNALWAVVLLALFNGRVDDPAALLPPALELEP